MKLIINNSKLIELLQDFHGKDLIKILENFLSKHGAKSDLNIDIDTDGKLDFSIKKQKIIVPVESEDDIDIFKFIFKLAQKLFVFLNSQSSENFIKTDDGDEKKQMQESFALFFVKDILGWTSFYKTCLNHLRSKHSIFHTLKQKVISFGKSILGKTDRIKSIVKKLAEIAAEQESGDNEYISKKQNDYKDDDDNEDF